MKKVILVIRDGWGYTKEHLGNAAYEANTPNDDNYMANYPHTLLGAHGGYVGLPDGTQGGSEPGHLTIGAGRVVWQPFEDINRKIRSGEFFDNPALMQAINNCKEKGSALHLMGLFSDQGIHGTTEHLYSLLDLAKRNGIEKVFIHPFLDGRDVPERSAKGFFEALNKKIEEFGVGKVASIIGRYYAMDRDNNYDRTEIAYRLLVRGCGTPEKDVFSAMDKFYESSDKSDYYTEPVIIVGEDDNPIGLIEDNDSVIFWNFRSDRTRQLTYAMTNDSFDGFDRGEKLDLTFVCMSRYDKALTLPVAFEQLEVSNNLGKVLSNNSLKQLRIAETEKYAHVTFFFNSQVEAPNEGEDRVMVQSPKVPSYAEKPEMSAFEINEKLIPEIDLEKYDFIAINFANGDLVGHSGVMGAGKKACEAVDKCLGEIVEHGLMKGYVIMVTADHGNIETMFYPNGEPNPSHGTNPVPFILISDDEYLKSVKLSEGGLSDVAPTILEIMEVAKPEEMDGKSLIQK